MKYDWRPSGARSATTDPNLRAVSQPPEGRGAPPGADRDDLTLAAAADAFLAAAEAGVVLNRSARPYRPSALRDLRGILEYHVVPELGEMRLRDVRRRHVQALVDRLGAERLSESRIRSVVSALRALYGHGIDQGEAEFNPADGLVMPRADEPGDRRGADMTSGIAERLGEIWNQRPDWQDALAWQDRPASETGPPEWQDAESRDDAGYTPISLLPERLLSFAVRAVLVLFAFVALAVLLESL